MKTCEWGHCTEPATKVHTIVFVGDSNLGDWSLAGRTSTRHYCAECAQMHADHCTRIARLPGHRYVLIAGELGSEALLAIEVMCHGFASFARAA